IRIAKVGGIAYEPASQDKLPQEVDRRNFMARRQRDKLIAAAKEENVAADQQGVGLQLDEGGKRCVEIAFAASAHDMDLSPEGACGVRHVIALGFGIRIIRIEQQADHGGVWHERMQQLESLCRKRSDIPAHARCVAAWSVEAGDQAGCDRIDSRRKNDRNSRGRCLGRQCCRRACRRQHGHRAQDQIGCQGRKSVVMIIRPAVFDRHILAFDVAGFGEAAVERRCERYVARSYRAIEEPDHRHRRLLRPRRERPRSRRAAEQRDECAAVHSMTSLAVICMISGTARPSALTSRATAADTGTNSCNNSSRSPAIVKRTWLTPVILPPGCARLATRPTSTGSEPMIKTIGIVCVAALAARAAAVVPATAMTATLRPTSSAASAGSRSY